MQSTGSADVEIKKFKQSQPIRRRRRIRYKFLVDYMLVQSNLRKASFLLHLYNKCAGREESIMTARIVNNKRKRWKIIAWIIQIKRL